MALSPSFPLSFPSSPSTFSPSPPNLSLLILHTRNRYSNTIKALGLKTSRHASSSQKIEVENEETQKANLATKIEKKKKRKPRPSFYEQVRHRWCVKTGSHRERFPWQEQIQEEEEKEKKEEEEMEKQEHSSSVSLDSSKDDVVNEFLGDPVSFALGNRLVSAPWIHRSKNNETPFSSQSEIAQTDSFVEEEEHGGLVEKSDDIKMVANGFGELKDEHGGLIEKLNEFKRVDNEFREKHGGFVENLDEIKRVASGLGKFEEEYGRLVEKTDEIKRVANVFVKFKEEHDGLIEKPNEIKRVAKGFGECEQKQKVEGFPWSIVDIEKGIVGSSGNGNLIELPWEKKADDVELMEREEKWRRRKTELAEKMIPEHELHRLRNISLRMKERIKVGAVGITQALVDTIHEKWKVDEVVKIKFEGPPACNMKRIHEILENRSGGLVIWRSGSSLVLYRGMAYKLPCVQTYNKVNGANHPNSVNLSKDSTDCSFRVVESSPTGSSFPKDLSENEFNDMSVLNDLLDGLGPRFKDWSGRDPQPVDADLLPGLVPGYTTPFRLLPYGVKPSLRNKEMTFYRRQARMMPPHFALGRNRELQGLAQAMVKLWERNAIAKIAIKRGVLNTCNERMAEELKKLTGGTLVSRNKEYIVFYRGNDFMSPIVTGALLERQKLVELRQDEEEQARQKASMLTVSNAKAAKVPPVAGTLAETMAANTRWGSEPSNEELEKMRRDSTLVKHALVVRCLNYKLTIAQQKFRKAERALAKVQEFLKPTELPTDLETISDEERFLFRKIGLSMKPFLLLGRRGVFDGTVENIHLHWKFRELVKILVKGKSFQQVKHIAISLEAESGGLLISVDKTNKGYAIIIYRGKNYRRPTAVRPKNLLTRRQALARSIELQRREALLHHISSLRGRIELLKGELVQMEAAKETGNEELYRRLIEDASDEGNDDDDFDHGDEGEEAYLETYDSADEGNGYPD